MTVHTRDHADVRLIAELLRHRVGGAGAADQAGDVRAGASLRKVQARLQPAEFRRWLEEDVRLPPTHADALMQLAATASDEVLRPIELR